MNIMMIIFRVVSQDMAETLTSRSFELRKEYRVNPKVVAMVDHGGTVILKDGVDLFKIRRDKRSGGSVSPLNIIGRPGCSALEAPNRLTAKYGERFKEKIYDESGNPRRFINIYVNPKDPRFLGHLDTTLKHEDEVLIIPAVGGG